MKMKCQKQKKQSDKDNKCGNEACNPFMPCASGNFYLMEKEISGQMVIGSIMENIAVKNDNRLASCITDFWHPPEQIISYNNS